MWVARGTKRLIQSKRATGSGWGQSYSVICMMILNPYGRYFLWLLKLYGSYLLMLFFFSSRKRKREQATSVYVDCFYTSIFKLVFCILISFYYIDNNSQHESMWIGQIRLLLPASFTTMHLGIWASDFMIWIHTNMLWIVCIWCTKWAVRDK